MDRPAGEWRVLWECNILIIINCLRAYLQRWPIESQLRDPQGGLPAINKLVYLFIREVVAGYSLRR